MISEKGRDRNGPKWIPFVEAGWPETQVIQRVLELSGPSKGSIFGTHIFRQGPLRIHLIGNGELWKMVKLIGFVSGIIKYCISSALQKSRITKKHF